MGQKIIIDLEAKTDKAVKEIADLKKEIQKLNKEVADSNKDTAQGLGNIEKSSNQAVKGIKKIGFSLKAGVFGLLVLAAKEIKKLFEQNQVVLDAFNTVFEVLSLAVNDFFNFIFDNVGGVVNAFKSIFNDPIQSLKDFGNALVDGVVVRFEQLVETLGFVAKGIGDLFKGNFLSAVENFKQAGKESVDIITGVDESYDDVVETLGNVVDATTNYVKETVKAGIANVQLGKQAEIARVRQQGLIESYDLQAEKLRQVRDEERNTIEERIAANNRLKETLDEQEEAMLKQVDLQIRAAQAEYNKNQSQENTIALLEAQQEKEAVLAQIAGFRSEQLANDLALNREKLELETSIKDAEAERQQAQREFDLEQIESEQMRLIAQKAALEAERLADIERLENKRDLYNEGTQAYADAQNELLAYQQETANKEIDIDKKLAKAKQQNITDALANIASIVGQNTKFGKAIAVVQAIRDTFAGANKALSASPPPFNFIAAAAVTAAGIANVRSITSTPDPSPPSFAKSSGGGSAVPATPSAPPAFNVVGASGANQLATAIAGQQGQPMKAYVVSGDVSTAQELDRNIVQGAAIG